MAGTHRLAPIAGNLGPNKAPTPAQSVVAHGPPERGSGTLVKSKFVSAKQ